MRIRSASVIGRDPELRVLRRTLRRARAGRGGAVFLTGEAGIGKSRLTAEIVSAATACGMRVAQGRATELGPMTPFRPITEALFSLFRDGPVPDDPALDPYRPALGQLAPGWGRAQEAASLVVLAEAVLRLLAVAGRDCGVLLVLEDLHDADQETLAVVEYLADNAAAQRSMLLLTCRHEEGNALHLAHRMAQRDAVTLLDVGRLDRDQVRRLLGECLPGRQPGTLPEAVVDLLWSRSDGVPFIAEELLRGLLGSGSLVTDGSRLVNDIPLTVPATITRAIVGRAVRLGEQTRGVLSVAAVIGSRFSIPVLRTATGLGERVVLGSLTAAAHAQLVARDDQRAGWFRFQHPLTAEALLAQIPPSDLAGISGLVADALDQHHPGLPGEWCLQAAVLRRDAGQHQASATLFIEAADRALTRGAPSTAVTLLDQADAELDRHPDPWLRADLLDVLFPALTAIGQFGRALELAETLPLLGGAGLSAEREVDLHVRAARVAVAAGRWQDGMARIEAARRLLGPDANDLSTAPVDAVAADLTVLGPGSDRGERAEKLARQAAEAAERAELPVIACQALITIGVLARKRDLDAAMSHYHRALELARRHDLVFWQLDAMLRRTVLQYLVDADPEPLHLLRTDALKVGAVNTARNLDATLLLHEVLCGRYDGTAERLADCLAEATRMQIDSLVRHLRATRTVLAAHQGRRTDMEAEIAEFDRLSGPYAQETSLVLGLARAFCALLEDDPRSATAELVALNAYEATNPTVYQLTGRHGLHLLLDVLARRADWPEYDDVHSAVAARMRWNRQFVLLAEAVLLGRDGKAAAATEAFEQAMSAAEPFPLARHLGLRLVAKAAHDDGWGEPVGWLRTAEVYFHRAGSVAVTNRCRALLRECGAVVRQRRTGTDHIPSRLRTLGMTYREYEVFQLLQLRLTNKAVAQRLHISSRTVEKHVASLLVKTGLPNRHVLCDYATRALTSDSAGEPETP